MGNPGSQSVRIGGWECRGPGGGISDGAWQGLSEKEHFTVLRTNTLYVRFW